MWDQSPELQKKTLPVLKKSIGYLLKNILKTGFFLLNIKYFKPD